MRPTRAGVCTVPRGGLLAGALFVLPGACVIGLLAWLYAGYGGLPLVQAAFLGIKAAVIVVVFQALRKVAARALTDGTSRALALGAFVALFVFGLPFPIIIALAAAIGFWRAPPATDKRAAPDRARQPPARPRDLGAALWSAAAAGALGDGADLSAGAWVVLLEAGRW